MERSQQCIDVLGYCGQIDPVAVRLCAHLSGIYTSLSHSSFDPRLPLHAENQTTATPEQHPIEYLFTTPPSPDLSLIHI